MEISCKDTHKVKTAATYDHVEILPLGNTNIDTWIEAKFLYICIHRAHNTGIIIQLKPKYLESISIPHPQKIFVWDFIRFSTGRNITISNNMKTCVVVTAGEPGSRTHR